MANPYPTVELNHVLRKADECAEIKPDLRYKEITVRLWGKGVKLRGEIEGASVATSRRQIARTGQFIVSRIDARNGAFGLIPVELEGAIVTNDFPLFNLDNTKLDPKYLEWMSRTSWFVDLCRTASEGTTNRVRLKEDRFLNSSIPLPDLEEQRLIVRALEAVSSQTARARQISLESEQSLRKLREQLAFDIFTCTGDKTVGALVQIQSGYAFKSEWFTQTGIRLVRNANIGHGHIDWTDTERIPESMRDQFGRFELEIGDILISLDRPLISTGVKVGRVSDRDVPSLLLQRVGRVRFLDQSIEPEFFFEWLRSPHFTKAIDPGRSNGVPHISPKDIERIPFAPPPRVEQNRRLRVYRKFHSLIQQLEEIHSIRSCELRAVVPAVLEKAFQGELRAKQLFSMPPW